LPDHSAAKTDQSDRGHIPTTTERTTKKDIIKIGTTDLVIQENNEGPMIFGESTNTTKKEDTTAIKIADPKYSMPRSCPSGLTQSQKRKLQRLRAKEKQAKEAKKIFNDTHPQYPPPQKRWKPKAIEINQTNTKTENEIATSQLSASTVVNLVPYSLYKKLGKQDDELVKTNMTLSGVGTDSSIKAKGVTSVELTIGTKILAVAFFVADVEGNYSLILGRDWIHATQCVPSTLHQMLLQWVGDDVEQVHVDASACIAVADAPVLWTYETATCLIGVDFLIISS
jgi:hypothetical protein